jgi:regulator of replication initiation timing
MINGMTAHEYRSDTHPADKVTQLQAEIELKDKLITSLTYDVETLMYENQMLRARNGRLEKGIEA